MKRATFWGVAACILFLVIVAILWPVATWHRIHDDLWPFDRSFVGPNLVASIIQWLIVAIVAVIVYPPLRRWAVAHWQHFHAKLDHNAVMLRHIIEHHPGIPNSILDEHPLPHRGHKPKKEAA